MQILLDTIIIIKSLLSMRLAYLDKIMQNTLHEIHHTNRLHYIADSVKNLLY